jgi:hypothetical protein
MRTLLPLLLIGCAQVEEGTDLIVLDDGGVVDLSAEANVVRRFFFVTEQDGMVDGFDLDERESPEGEAESCGHGDAVAPDGRTGIDNQLGQAWTVLEPLIGEAVQALLQGSINEGRFLMMIELTGIDDLVNDDDVTLELFYGRLDPVIGTLGLIAPDQTFYVDESKPVSRVEGARLVDGRIEAGPVTFTAPIDILEEQFDIPITAGRIRIDIGEDGSFVGILGGGINVPETMAYMLASNAAAEARLVEPIFYANADMGLDGEGCEVISVAFGFEGTTGFVVRYPGE